MSVAAASSLVPSSGKVFKPVSGKTPDLMSIMKDIFDRILKPLYGSQDDPLKKISLAQDRVSYLLYEDGVPVGVLVFKNVLSDEFEKQGIRRSIEIKSLFVVDAEKNSGRGLADALLAKCLEEGAVLGLGHEGFHVTVSETKADSFLFFSKRKFSVRESWKGKYTQGKTEFLLYRPVEERADSIFQKVIRAPSGPEEVKRAQSVGQGPFIAQLVSHVTQAHLGDIHALKRLANGTFISGSKDNCLYQWDKDGKLVRPIYEVDASDADTADWVTTVEVLNKDYWLSGERSGRIRLWRASTGEYVRDILPKLPKIGHVSSKENARRINCLTPGLDPENPSVFIGLPTLFDEYSFIEGRTTSSTIAHNNDWVYAVQPIDLGRILTVVAGNVELWKKNGLKWSRDKVIVKEPPKTPKTRFHITKLVPLADPSKKQYVTGAFGGGLRIIDMEKAAVLKDWNGHANKNVWTIEAMSPSLFASSGEEGVIRFWDTRSYNQVHALEGAGHGGGIGALLQLQEHLLVAGTFSPPMGAASGAQLRFYDVRK
jgi:WD40 repeat protein